MGSRKLAALHVQVMGCGRVLIEQHFIKQDDFLSKMNLREILIVGSQPAASTAAGAEHFHHEGRTGRTLSQLGFPPSFCVLFSMHIYALADPIQYSSNAKWLTLFPPKPSHP